MHARLLTMPLLRRAPGGRALASVASMQQGAAPQPVAPPVTWGLADRAVENLLEAELFAEDAHEADRRRRRRQQPPTTRRSQWGIGDRLAAIAWEMNGQCYETALNADLAAVFHAEQAAEKAAAAEKLREWIVTSECLNI